MAEPTERDRERAEAACEYSGTSSPSAWEAGYAQALADERARNVARLRKLAPDADDMNSGAQRQGWLDAADALEADLD